MAGYGGAFAWKMESASGLTCKFVEGMSEAFGELGAVRSFENTKESSKPSLTNSDTTLSVSDINGITKYKTQPRPNLRHA